MADDRSTQMPSRSRPARPSRQQLLFSFDIQRDANETDRSYFVATSYPPSSKPLAELSTIAIADLELESHHRGKVLVMRCIEQPIRSAAIQTIIEDPNGTAERLALYNTLANLEAGDILPEDSLFALKEPYYEQTNQGNCVRVDHPSDLISLSPSSTLLPRIFQPTESKSALQWKDEGNAAYGSKKYYLALQLYNNALDAISESKSSDEISLRRLVLRNRTMAHSYSGHFECALTDAQAAIIPQGEAQEDTDIKRNTTAYFRAGRAAYELHRYSDAEEFFNESLRLSPGDVDSLRELNKIKDRRKEILGEYDFDTMSKSASKKYNRLDRADFTTCTIVKFAGDGRGRGLFADKDFKAGELIMCEKALSASFDSDLGASSGYAILNSKTQKRTIGTTATLLFQLIDKLSNNPETAKKFFDLQDGNHSPKTPLTVTDGVVPLDTFRTLAILDNNCYGCPTVRSSSDAAQAQLASSTGYPSSGVWVHASYINHACNGNAMRSFIGDMMIVRATRDIKTGNEICMPYRLPHPNNSVTQEELKKIWGFKCDCSLCRAEGASSSKEKLQRVELGGRAVDFISKNKLKAGMGAGKKTIEQAARIYERLEKTYHSERFDKMPRPGMVGLGTWLCDAYNSVEDYEKLTKSSTHLLRDFGLLVDFEGDSYSVQREHCSLESRAVEAAVYAAKAYKARGYDKASRNMSQLARELYEILNGEMRGFDDRYGL